MVHLHKYMRLKILERRKVRRGNQRVSTHVEERDGRFHLEKIRYNMATGQKHDQRSTKPKLRIILFTTEERSFKQRLGLHKDLSEDSRTAVFDARRQRHFPGHRNEEPMDLYGPSNKTPHHEY